MTEPPAPDTACSATSRMVERSGDADLGEVRDDQVTGLPLEYLPNVIAMTHSLPSGRAGFRDARPDLLDRLLVDLFGH